MQWPAHRASATAATAPPPAATASVGDAWTMSPGCGTWSSSRNSTHSTCPTTARLVVVLGAEVGDELITLGVAQRVLQLHELDEQIVLRVQAFRSHRRLPVERQPLLDARHPRALREVHEQRQVEDDRRSQDRVAAEEVDLDLHRVVEPPADVDVVPAFLRIA